MAEDKATALCQQIVNQLVYQIEEYQNNGFEIVGMIGISGSPTCGVETTEHLLVLVLIWHTLTSVKMIYSPDLRL